MATCRLTPSMYLTPGEGLVPCRGREFEKDKVVSDTWGKESVSADSWTKETVTSDTWTKESG